MSLTRLERLRSRRIFPMVKTAMPIPDEPPHLETGLETASLGGCGD